MASRFLSRAGRLLDKSQCWTNQRAVTAHQGLLASCQSCRLQCASGQPAREMASSSSSSGRSQEEVKEDTPIPYSSSRALEWSVHNSYGRHRKRPLYKVAPVSIGLIAFLAWVFLREETEIDRQLEVHLHERLPNLFPAEGAGSGAGPAAASAGQAVAKATEESPEKAADEETPTAED